jgi:allantoin racemase
MRLLLANPNATQAITDACAGLARAAASPGTEIVPWTNREGPPVVDSVYGDYAAGRPLARALAALRPVPDAVVLAGFGNYGTGAVKEALDVPALGMAEAAMALALPLCHRFAVVTTAARMVPYTEDLVAQSGLGPRCAGVRAVDLPPLGAESPGTDAAVVAGLAAQVAHAIDVLGADLVILGGARLAPYAAAVRRLTAVPILEPVACAVGLAEALVRLGLRPSKVGKYAPPPQPLDRYG